MKSIAAIRGRCRRSGVRPSTALLAAVAVAGCKGNGLTQSAAALLVTGPAGQVSQSADKKVLTVDFGDVPVGATATVVLSLASDGVPVLVNTVAASQSDAEFQLPLVTPVDVSLSTPAAVSASFTPTSGGSKQAVYTVGSDSAVNNPLTVTLRGTAVPFALTAAPNPVDFGNVLIHQLPSLTVTVTNTSALPQPLVLGTPQGGSTSNPANLFTVHPPSVAVVPPNGTASVQIDYGPVVGQNPPVADTATVSLANCASTCRGLTLNLRGVALETALTVIPDPVRFGFLAIGQTGNQLLQIHNASTATVTLSAPGLDGGSFAPAPFAFGTLPRFPLRLVPDAGASLPLSFVPSQIGEYNGVAIVNSDDPLTPHGLSVPLIGYGGGAQIGCLPSALPFGPVAVGTSQGQVLVCTNTGTDVPGHPEAALSLSAPTLSGSPAFTSVPVADAGLAAGQSAFLRVNFAPTAAGEAQGALLINSNATQGAAPVIPLSGIGVLPAPCSVSIRPPALDFGEVPKGSTAILSFAVENLANSYCVVQGLGLRPGSDPAFKLPQGPIASQTLSFPGDPNNVSGLAPVTLEIPVAFGSTAQAAATGDVDFMLAQTANGSRTVPLNATSAATCLAVTPDPVDFGLVGYDAADQLACSYAAQTVIVANTCATAQELTAIAVTPDPAGGAPAFTTRNPGLPVMLAAGQSTTFEAKFTPNALGAAAGTVEISSSGSTVPYTVALQGLAAASGERLQNFVVPKLKADILMVLDDSFGEPQLLYEVTQGPLQNLVAYANAAAIDYHFGLTTSDTCGNRDDGNLEPCPQCLINNSQNSNQNPIIVSPASLPDPATLLNDLWLGMVSHLPGLSPCLGFYFTDFDAVNLALQPALLAGHNAGFLRTDSQLLVLIVNGNDAYIAAGFGADYPQVVARLLQVRPRGGVSMIYLEPGLAPATPGNVLSAIQLLGKGAQVDASVYGRWPAELVSSFAESIGSGVFSLATAPARGSLQVSVNDAGIPPLGDKGPNWIYDPLQHQVVFQLAALPQPGQTVSISYQVACGPIPDGGSPVPDAGPPQCNQPGGLPAYSQCVLDADCACGLKCAPDTVNFTTASFCERPCLVGDAGCPAYETCNAATGTCSALCNPTTNGNEFAPCSVPGDCACPLQCTTDLGQGGATLCERGCQQNSDCIGINEFCSVDGGNFCQRADQCNPVSGFPELSQGCVQNADCACPTVCVDDPFITDITYTLGNTCERPCKSNADCHGEWQTCNQQLGVCQTLDHCVPADISSGGASVFGLCQDGVPGAQCACGLSCVLDPSLSKTDGGTYFCEFCDGGSCQTPGNACRLPDAGTLLNPEILNYGCNSNLDCNCPDSCVFDPGRGSPSCRAKCRTDADCLDPTTACNTQSGYCNFVPCSELQSPFLNCPVGTCTGNACFAPGTATTACDPQATRATPAGLCAPGLQCVPRPDGGGDCETPCDNNAYPASGCAGSDTCIRARVFLPGIDFLYSCFAVDPSGCSVNLPPAVNPGESGYCGVNTDCACPELCTGTDDQGSPVCQRPCTLNSDCPNPLTACVGNVCTLQSCGPVGSYCQAGGVDGTCVAFDHLNPSAATRGGVCERGGTATGTCSLAQSGAQPATVCVAGDDCFPLDAGTACFKLCGYDGGCAPGQQCGWLDNWREDPELACLTLAASGCDPAHPFNENENCNSAADCACGLDCVVSADNNIGVYGTNHFCERPCASSADCGVAQVCDGRPGQRHCISSSCGGQVSGTPIPYTNNQPNGSSCNVDGIGDGTCLDLLPPGEALPSGPNALVYSPACVKAGTAKGSCNPAATRANPADLCVVGASCLTFGGSSTCTPVCNAQNNRPDGTNPACAPNQSCFRQSQDPQKSTAYCYPPQGVP